MPKDPVLPLYYNDISSSTLDWTDEEFGAYMRLLIYQWDKGGIPKDYQRLTRIATSLGTTWPMIKKKFDDAGDVLKNPVMESIRTKRLIHKQKQKENIEKRYQNPTKPPTKTLPLEKEIEIEKEEFKINIPFDAFWEAYDKKIERSKCEPKWNRLKPEERQSAMSHISEYKNSQPDKKYRKNPDTYLNNKSWNDEIIFSNGTGTQTPSKSTGASKLLNLLADEIRADGTGG